MKIVYVFICVHVYDIHFLSQCVLFVFLYSLFRGGNRCDPTFLAGVRKHRSMQWLFPVSATSFLIEKIQANSSS